MPSYSVENPMAGAIRAYKGRKIMVKRKEPGMAVQGLLEGQKPRSLQSGLPATVYLVHKLENAQ